MQLTVHRLQLPRKLQRALVFGIVLATCCLWIQVFLRKRVVNPIAGNEWSLGTDLGNIIHKYPPINLAIYVREEPNLMQFYTLLKNILYYQGRKKMNTSGCLLSVQTISNRGCPTVKLPPPNPLLLHLVVDEESRLNITRTFNDWKLVNVYVIFYEYKRYKSLVEPYGGSKSIGEAGMMKLLWPEIIKVPTTKIILLDTDMLFNRNITELWNMFDDFKSTQMIGGVFEQTYYRKGLITSPGFPILKSGINTGMLLLHIERMRKMKWSELWRNTTKILLAKATMMSIGDQCSTKSCTETLPICMKYPVNGITSSLETPIPSGALSCGCLNCLTRRIVCSQQHPRPESYAWLGWFISFRS
ncbi:unnamed protein product [Calicophoron daubneyi]|uniref:Uncharacterized protein n=1 Tax=Calicophoron daubneyi TaxID=300641 RepID=A0AAV2TI99_CALDB